MPADRSALRRDIIGLLEPELEALGFALLDVRLFAGGGRLNVRIFVDVEGGVDLAACMRASRSAGMLLEESALLSDAYVIEVSSPGVRRPLRTREHFAAHLGERVELRLGRGAGATVLRVVLVAAGPEALTARPAGQPGPATEDVDPDADAGADTGDDAGEPEADDATEAVPGPAGEREAGPGQAAGSEAGPGPAGGNEAGTEAEAETIEIRYGEIEAANLDPDFDIHALINADRRRRKDERREERRQARAAREAKAPRRRKPGAD